MSQRVMYQTFASNAGQTVIFNTEANDPERKHKPLPVIDKIIFQVVNGSTAGTIGFTIDDVSVTQIPLTGAMMTLAANEADTVTLDFVHGLPILPIKAEGDSIYRTDASGTPPPNAAFQLDSSIGITPVGTITAVATATVSIWIYYHLERSRKP